MAYCLMVDIFALFVSTVSNAYTAISASLLTPAYIGIQIAGVK